MKRRFLAAVVLASVALAAPFGLRDGLGRQVTVNTPTKRIVALSLTATEVLLDLGISPVGRPSSAVHPELAKSLPDIGGAYRPDTEKILALKPDLLLGSVGTTAAIARQISALPVPLVVTPDSSIKDVYDTYTLVGKLTGQEERAAAVQKLLAARVKQEIAKIPSASKKPKVLALLAAGGMSFSTTDETYIGDLIEKLGGINIAKGTPSADPRQPGFVLLSFEQIIAANPDVVLAFRPRTASGEFAPSPLEKLETQVAWKSLSAVKNNRVHLLDADPFVTAPGPRVLSSLASLRDLLYPKQ